MVELKNLQKVSEELLDENTDLLAIILHGSRARGDFREHSDYDFFLITRRGESYFLQSKYRTALEEKLDCWAQIILLPYKQFESRYKIGESFVYSAARDAKLLACRSAKIKQKLEKLPRITRNAWESRMKIAKEQAQRTREVYKRIKPEYLGAEAESLGYAAMHLVWGICMSKGFCPKSKHTALEEAKPYFNSRDFKYIKRAYLWYKKASETILDEEEVSKELFEKTMDEMIRVCKESEIMLETVKGIALQKANKHRRHK